MDYGVILASTETTITRTLILNGRAVVQHFTTPVEIPLDRPAAQEVLTMAEDAEEQTQQERRQGDAYLEKLAREEHEMPVQTAESQYQGMTLMEHNGWCRIARAARERQVEEGC